MGDETGKPKDGSTTSGSGARALDDAESPEERTVVKGMPSTASESGTALDNSEEKTAVQSTQPPPNIRKPPPSGPALKKTPPVTGVVTPKPPKTLAALVAELSRATPPKLKDLFNGGPTDASYWYWRAKDQHFALVGLAAEIVNAASRENVPDGQILVTETKGTDQSSSQLDVELICSSNEVYWRARKDADREEIIAAELKKNNEETWDWITWETLGNPGKDYRRSDRMRKLGLYKLSYDLLRKANDDADKWAPASTEGGEIGGGRVRIHVLEDLDYSAHESLIKTFLPGFSIEGDRLVEPAQRQGGVLSVSRVLNNTANSSLSLIMPYNYDDNRMGGRTLGTDMAALPGYNEKSGCGRLDRELDRWSTASRSMIVAFDSLSKSEQLHKDKLIWPWRKQGNTQEIIDGDPDDMLLSDYAGLNTDREFYSVKTGVTFVGKAEETSTGKDLLESNSLHAMYRSRLIDGICRKYPSEMAGTRFQLEILTVTIERPNPAKDGGGMHWDGFQVRNIPGLKRNEIWFPGTAIPNHGKAFAQCATGDNTDGVWQEFWQTSFAEALGRAKAQMLVYCGLQHMTANAQNMLAIFSRGQPGGMGPSTEITLRDVGDTCLNDTFFKVLKTVQDPDVKKLFNDMWSKETASPAHGVFLDRGDWGKYSPPYVTRTMGQSVFFMQRFFQELTVPDDSQRCKLALKWNVALNESFMDYMREKIGYPSPITVGGSMRGYTFDENVKDYRQQRAAVWGDLESQAFICEATKGAYPQLVPKLQQLSPGVRQNLLFEVWTKIQSILNSSDVLDEKGMQYLGSAHELLIGIEIDEWVKTPEGKKALLALHGG